MIKNSGEGVLAWPDFISDSHRCVNSRLYLKKKKKIHHSLRATEHKFVVVLHSLLFNVISLEEVFQICKGIANI